MKVFMDSDYKCHVNHDGSMREIEDSFLTASARRLLLMKNEAVKALLERYGVI